MWPMRVCVCVCMCVACNNMYACMNVLQECSACKVSWQDKENQGIERQEMELMKNKTSKNADGRSESTINWAGRAGFKEQLPNKHTLRQKRLEILASGWEGSQHTVIKVYKVLTHKQCRFESTLRLKLQIYASTTRTSKEVCVRIMMGIGRRKARQAWQIDQIIQENMCP
jgi:hypothetical protein